MDTMASQNHQPHDYLLNRLFKRSSKKTSKLRVTGICEGNSPVTGEFPVQMASNAENIPIWWRQHGITSLTLSNTLQLHTTTSVQENELENVVCNNCLSRNVLIVVDVGVDKLNTRSMWLIWYLIIYDI